MVTDILNLGPDFDRPLRLDFSVAGVQFAASIEPEQTAVRLTLTGDFGPAPFSAQGRDLREALQRLDEDPMDRLRLTKGRVGVQHQRMFAQPTTSTDLVAMLVEAVLDCQGDAARLSHVLAEITDPAQPQLAA